MYIVSIKVTLSNLLSKYDPVLGMHYLKEVRRAFNKTFFLYRHLKLS